MTAKELMLAAIKAWCEEEFCGTRNVDADQANKIVDTILKTQNFNVRNNGEDRQV